MDISAVSFLLIGIFTKKKAVITKSVITTCTGAGDRTRTGTLSPAVDFESTTSTIPSHRQVLI